MRVILSARQITTLVLTSLSIFGHVGSATAECTKDEAYNRMMIFDQHLGKIQQQYPDPRKDPQKANEIFKIIRDYGEKSGKASELIAQEKYTEACKIYDELAKEYRVDEKASNTLTLKELEADGGRSRGDGSCNLTDAALKMSDLSQKFQKAVAERKLSEKQIQQYSAKSSKIGTVMSSNPSEACAMISELAAEYHF